MLQQTPLYSLHRQARAQLVDFAGWEMPLHYGSQLQEHHYVRQQSGIFDVSHMGVVAVTGSQASTYLRFILSNDVQKLANGFALYTCLLNQQGGVIDDLIVYHLAEQDYRLIINASRRQHDLTWLQQQSASFAVNIALQPEFCILALQGPEAISQVLQLLPEKAAAVRTLKSFQLLSLPQGFIARTGYTGEDGVEMIVPAEIAIPLWQKALQQGAHPCGLGARNTLRLEAGLNLYGHDMDENTTPLESGLSFTVDWQDPTRNFIGKQALLEQKRLGIKNKLAGLIMLERGVLRDEQKVLVPDVGEGIITSGSFSPTLGHSIALARIPVNSQEHAFVERRGQMLPVTIVKPPFVRHGKKV